MKHLICLLLSFISLDRLNAQQVRAYTKHTYFDSTHATRWQGDSSFSVQLVSEDSNVKVYNGTLPEAAKYYGHATGAIMMRGRDTLEWPWGMPPPVPKGEGPVRRAILLKDLSNIEPVSLFTFAGDTMTILNPNSLWQAKNRADSAWRSLWPAFPKIDTIGPQLRLVSDTGKGWNPVSAMWIYEVRVYVNQWEGAVEMQNEGKDAATERLNASRGLIIPTTPRHYRWLDSNKKPIKLKVWDAQ